MRTFDMHGKRVLAAEKLFHDQLNESRLKNRLIEVMFITGSGVIQKRLIALAEESELHHYVQLSNRGCLVIEFE